MDSIIEQLINESVNDLQSKQYIDPHIDYEYTIYYDIKSNKYIIDREKALKHLILYKITQYFDKKQRKN